MIYNNTENCNDFAILNEIYDNPPTIDIPLAKLSQRDGVWDSHRVDAMIVESIYAHESQFEKYAQRMYGCSGFLKFGFNEKNGLVLRAANFCRVRYCTVCQWRRSLYWRAMMYKSYEQIKTQYPKHRFIFLTLTIENPHINDLRDTIAHMNSAWKKLTKRKEFDIVDGWIRTTEITRDSKRPNTHAHPHFHVILMVKPSYFNGKNYIKQNQWAELWRDCLRVDYMPVVDVRAVKPKSRGGGDDGGDDAVKSAIVETLKYAVKPDDIMHDAHDKHARAWFYELTRQTHKLRFIASGGALKNALKNVEPTNDEMIHTRDDDENERVDARRLNFTFYRNKRAYIYNPIHNE